MLQKLTGVDRGLCLKMGEQLPHFHVCCDPWLGIFCLKRSVWNVQVIWSPEISPRDSVVSYHSECFHVMRFPPLDACFLSHVSELLNIRELCLGTQSVGSSFTGSLIVFFISTFIAVISAIMMTDLKDSAVL